jgi:protocatechuate 3,4-dioxygenase alpha subunit
MGAEVGAEVGLVPTPSQTAGPFVEIGMRWRAGGRLVPPGTPGEIRLGGVVLDGEGEVVIDAVLEFWQADRSGSYVTMEGSPPPGIEGWTGFTTALTDPAGRYVLWTVKPGRIASAPGHESAGEAPHVNVSIFARGLLQRLVTRIYFDDEQAANEKDPVLSGIGEPGRRGRLIATSSDDGYSFDIRLQGEGETPFFVP